MFKANQSHRQPPESSPLDELSPKQRQRLEASWAGTFYREVFCPLDENIFAVLYSEKDSRPNIPVNILLGLEILKMQLGWTDEDLYDEYNYNLQVRYALGIYDLSAHEFSLRTLYNFRQRVHEYARETGVNLYQVAFENLTAEMLTRPVASGKSQRWDSTLLWSNIRDLRRYELVLETMVGAVSSVDATLLAEIKAELAPYLQYSVRQQYYHLKYGAAAEKLTQLGDLIAKLLRSVAADTPAWQILTRVFAQQFQVDETGRPQPLRASELKAENIQSPHDPQATYRKKGQQTVKGVSVNLSETNAPENKVQLITDIRVAGANSDDAAFINAERLENLKQRTGLESIDLDGGYSTPDSLQTLQDHDLTPHFSAIRGSAASTTHVSLDELDWQFDKEQQLVGAQCPHGAPAGCPRRHSVELLVQPRPRAAGYQLVFAETKCPHCTDPQTGLQMRYTQRKQWHVLAVGLEALNLARLRQNTRTLRQTTGNLRAAVEASIRSLKLPFRHDQLPVRGQQRILMLLAVRCIAINYKRIWHPRVDQLAQAASLFDWKGALAGRFCLRRASIFKSFLQLAKSRLRLALSELAPSPSTAGLFSGESYIVTEHRIINGNTLLLILALLSTFNPWILEKTRVHLPYLEHLNFLWDYYTLFIVYGVWEYMHIRCSVDLENPGGHSLVWRATEAISNLMLQYLIDTLSARNAVHYGMDLGKGRDLD